MSKNKPFDLEAAKTGKKVVTRQGYRYTLLRWDLEHDKYKLAGVVKDESGEWVCQHQIDGRWSELVCDHPRDLFMAPEIREYWVNLHRNYYDCSNPITVSRVWYTQEQALSRANVRDHSYIKTIKIHEEEI